MNDVSYDFLVCHGQSIRRIEHFQVDLVDRTVGEDHLKPST
ncbi:MAG TPA: hypothetical protein VHY37_12750 [Tepidisphaeraceae bacterium]|nr:hypothetical protein [Tepidisphaeraceae bacterium]